MLSMPGGWEWLIILIMLIMLSVPAGVVAVILYLLLRTQRNTEAIRAKLEEEIRAEIEAEN
jgi:low affinity Fe/Cu permease